ncbi:MAG: hypothetical protein ACJA1H_002117 [Glaciecola sp.]|jgi:hypothetical protein
MKHTITNVLVLLFTAANIFAQVGISKTNPNTTNIPIPFLNQQLNLDIDGKAAGDQSGISVSLSADGTRVAVGANVNNAGYVSLYDWDGSTWVQIGSDINGEAIGDQSGYAVSLSADGTRIAIGASGNDGNGTNSGHVRLYDWNDSKWVQIGADIDGEAAGDQSGYAVSLSAQGTRVAIGSRGNSSNTGHVRLFDWDGLAWSQTGIDIDGETEGDWSGYSVSLSADGTRVAIGSILNSRNTGHVRLYDWNGSAWLQTGLNINGEAKDDASGWSVSLSSDGSRVAIGAVFNASNEISSGHVRLYDWDGSAWLQVGKDINGEATGDWSGFSVSLSASGTRVAIGALLNNGDSDNTGHVRLYDWNGSVWSQTGKDIDGEAADDYSGSSVSLSADGTHLAIGAAGNDGNGSSAGHVRIFQ